MEMKALVQAMLGLKNQMKTTGNQIVRHIGGSQESENNAAENVKYRDKMQTIQMNVPTMMEVNLPVLN